MEREGKQKRKPHTDAKDQTVLNLKCVQILNYLKMVATVR